MLSRLIAAREIERLSGLEFFSALKPVAVNELIRALNFADTEIIAAGIVNEWMEEHKVRPTPADLFEAVDRHNRAAHIALRTESEVPWVNFEDWCAAGNEPAWDAFLEWVMSDATSMPRRGGNSHGIPAKIMV